jgi:exopolysaccharide production protein ExoQ
VTATEVTLVASTGAGSAERAFVVLVLLCSTGAFASAWTVPGETQHTSGMFVMQILWSMAYAVTIYAFFRHCKQPLHAFLAQWPLVALCALAIASIFWSQAPGLTFRRSMALTLTLVFGIYFASRFRLREQFRLLAWTFGTCIVFSFAFGMLGLGMSVDADKGVPGWYGIFVQKNDLGEIMVLSALVFHFWKKAEPEHKRIANAGLIGSIALIGLSRSMTSVVVFGLLMILLPYLRWTVKKPVRWMVSGIAILLAAGSMSLLYVATHLEQITGFLGRSATLTGRVQIWILSTVMALRRPWLGYGYNAFWLPSEWFTVRIWHAMNWDAPHAHNGLIEIWLELGAIGVGFFLIAFLYYLVRALLHSRKGGKASIWPVVFLVYMFLNNLTESNLLSRNTIYFILLATTAVLTQRISDDAHVQMNIPIHGEAPI